MPLELVKIRFDDVRYSWTVVDESGAPIDSIRGWIVHLEEIDQSPNTIQAYARHISRLGSYLRAHDKDFPDISVNDYDCFLQWLPYYLQGAVGSGANVAFLASSLGPATRLSSTLRSQIHLAVKSFYRYLTGRQPSFSSIEVNTHYDGLQTYKPFLEHINERRGKRQKDPYLRGDLSVVRKKITDKRIAPGIVLELILACRMLRDAFLLTLLYNTGMRIGEALGLRHADIDLSDKVIWVVPRSDNENGARAKSRRARAIPVLPYLLEMYEDYITSLEYQNAFESGTEYVFCNVQRGRVGRALSRSYAENLKTYLVRRTGKPFTWHHFRHTHASEAIAEGHGLLAVADRLGHASPQTTLDFYKHLFSSEVRKIHLTGPKTLEDRLKEFSGNNFHLSERGIRWI